jgi:CubicO group peptidase (beta-lactamase class C family)
MLTSRLNLLHRILSGYIERQEMPGLVALVSHREETQVEALGTLAFDNAAPMARDTIFRIASLTKPVAAVGAMILIEECKIRLEDPIGPWLPELATPRVLKSISSDTEDTVPARRPITLRDLLTYCMGFGAVIAPPDTYPIQKAIAARGLTPGPPRPSESLSTGEWLLRLGSLPLLAQPGERWMYHISGEVLGPLIERVSGQSLGTFLYERIFEPLGMKDTSFQVPPEKRDRLPTVYFRQEPSRLEVFDAPPESSWNSPPPMESAGGGLVSTIDDYFAFSKMMLNKGRVGGRLKHERILSPASIELMTSDQLAPEQRADSEIFFGSHSSWGFGVAVDIGRREIFHNPGRFGWTGGLGTIAYTDPARELIGILFTQRMMDSPVPPRIFSDFWTLAYTALE